MNEIYDGFSLFLHHLCYFDWHHHHYWWCRGCCEFFKNSAVIFSQKLFFSVIIPLYLYSSLICCFYCWFVFKCSMHILLGVLQSSTLFSYKNLYWRCICVVSGAVLVFLPKMLNQSSILNSLLVSNIWYCYYILSGIYSIHLVFYTYGIFSVLWYYYAFIGFLETDFFSELIFLIYPDLFSVCCFVFWALLNFLVTGFFLFTYWYNGNWFFFWKLLIYIHTTWFYENFSVLWTIIGSPRITQFDTP